MVDDPLGYLGEAERFDLSSKFQFDASMGMPLLFMDGTVSVVDCL